MSYDSWKLSGPSEPSFGTCALCNESEEDHKLYQPIPRLCPNFREPARELNELLEDFGDGLEDDAGWDFLEDVEPDIYDWAASLFNLLVENTYEER